MDVFNEADNLLYDIAAANSERKKLKGGSIGSKVRHYCSSLNPLAFNCWIAFKIKAINENLQEVMRHDNVPRAYGNVTQRERGRETISFVDPSNIIGRVEDKEKIIEILIQPTKGDDVTLLPIVGIRGLGKTTLAHLVYNDERIKMQFELELWICVSTKISLEELVRKIIVSIGRSQRQDRMDDMTLGDLSYEFLKLLGGKRYLLVLDNVGDVDRESCFVLKRLFMKGANGSRILVTTRSNGIAKFMATVPPFELERLSFQDSLSLFFRVFFRDHPDSPPPSSKIVEEFVQSCGGVPLAIEVIGTLLSSNNTLENRRAVRGRVIFETNPFHDVLLPILKSNYDILSPDLRQCFKCCAFFPRDYEFNSFELIQFWETLGLIKFKDDYKASGIENEYEAMGEENLEHLCSVSLLKVCKKELFYSKFRITQLIYDMALYLVRDEFTMVKSSTRIINKRIKHLTFVKPKLSQQCARALLDNIGLIRTLIFFDKVEQYLVESFIQRCQHLQVLILRNSSLKALPRGIGGLNCLKYLDLTGNKSFKEIPNSLCILHNLKTLILDGCAEVEELPRDIRKLRSLNMLFITTKQRYLPENGVGCLRSLRFLAIIGCQNLKYLPQYINLLTSLRTWIIRDCDSLISLPSSMKYLIELETLVIANCQQLELDKVDYNTGILNASGLSLHRFWIANLPQLGELPQWLVRKSAETLRCLHIEDCQSIKFIPNWLTELTLLEGLEILNCPNLSLPPEITNFAALDKAKIEGCPHLTQQIFASQSASDFRSPGAAFEESKEESSQMEEGKGLWAENECDSFEATQPATSSMDGAGPSTISSVIIAPPSGKVPCWDSI